MIKLIIYKPQSANQNKVKAIVDFTSSSKELMEEAVRILAPLNPEVYIFVSAAAVYDVSDNPKQVVKLKE